MLFLVLLLFSFFTYTQIDPKNTGFVFGFSLTIIFISLFILYFFNWKKVKISKKWLWAFLLITALTYPAGLSHDVFNYVFDARILKFYHQWPWLAAPANFIGDSWLPFLHWQNSTSRYGPIWIGLTSLVVTSNLWFSIYTVKIVAIMGSLVCWWFLRKLTTKTAVNFWLLNPLVITEMFISPHIDTWMTAFVLMGLYYWKGSRQARMTTACSLISSLGIKIVALPMVLLVFVKKEKIFVWAVILAYLGSLIIILRWSINPWYFTLPITLSALVVKNKFWRYLTWSLSVASLVRYLPYFYLGFFDPGNKIRAVLFGMVMLPFIFWSVKTILIPKSRR